MGSLLSILKFTIGWPISILAIFFIVKILLPQLPTIITNLKNINLPLLGISIICFILYYFIRSYVWKLILKEQGCDIPFKTASFLWEMSEIKRYVPGTIWSFLGRTSIFGQYTPSKTILKSILIEVQFLLLANIIISIISIPLILKAIVPIIPHNSLAISLAVLSVFFLIIVYIFSTEIINYIKFKPLNLLRRILPNFSPKTKISMLLVACVYSFFFALGSFFAAISISYISPDSILQVIGFFSFSFLIGYVSLIPMGVGIREGITTIGLAKIIPLAMAGFISIFARIVLIVSELLFLLTTLLCHHTKNKLFLKIEDFVSNHKHEVVLSIFIFLYIAYFTIASFLRYDNFYTGRFDLGNMDQTVWNTIHGRIFQTSDPNGSAIISRLTSHADFILILLSPLYLLWPHAKMLLVIQTIVLAFGSIFVYLIAKNIIENKNLSVTLGVLFLFNPALEFTNLYDFHAVTFSTTFLLAAFYFITKYKYILTCIFMILAGITKEQVWIIVSFLGVYILLKKTYYQKKIITKKLIGATVFIVSAIIFYYLIWHAIPNIRGGQHFALSFYSDFGDSPTTIVKNVIFSPQKNLSTIIQKPQLTYLKDLFQPLGFMPIFAIPFMVFAFPDLFINLLSKSPPFHQIYYQYSATITPFIFISTIFGIKNLKVWFPKIPNTFFIFYLTFFTLVSAYHLGPLVGSKKPNIAMFTKQLKDAKAIDQFLSTIPSQHNVAATNNIGSHLSQRQKIATIPKGIDHADYIVFLLNDSFAQPSLKEQREMAERLKLDKNYIKIFNIGDFIAFRKKNLE